ncbi:MAG: response regulator [Desulfobacterales bacterium]|nr:response regulator [Desulfobacterales bacterium]
MTRHKILLVDDDKFILQSVGNILEKSGYDITRADSGQKAIEFIEKEEFDMVLTDLIMDSIDGIEVLKKTKEINPDTMVIILTGFGDLDSAIDALRLKADDYLLKPCEPTEISFKISSCLEKLELKRRITVYENIYPICCVCKSVRNDEGKEPGTGEWISVEEYFWKIAKLAPSSTYCPKCAKKLMEDISSR